MELLLIRHARPARVIRPPGPADDRSTGAEAGADARGQARRSASFPAPSGRRVPDDAGAGPTEGGRTVRNAASADPGSGHPRPLGRAVIVDHDPDAPAARPRVDPELTDAGRAQAQALAAWLGVEPLHAVYTSPLTRARDTAAPLASTFGLPVTVDDDLAEWDRNADDYVPVEELRAENATQWRALAAERWDELGVDIEGFRSRVITALDRISARHRSQHVAVVCHGGVINAYLASVLGTRRVLFFEPAYTSISRVVVTHRDGAVLRSVRSVNETAHLRALG
jgi:probable phosphoglycerate mutase